MVDELISSVTEDDTDEPPSTSDEEPPSVANTALLLRKHVAGNQPAWNDWHWQMRNRIRSVSDLASFLPRLNAAGIEKTTTRFPMAITPYYASLINRADYSDPIFMMSVPQAQELYDSPFVNDDPLEEEEDTVVPGLVHRYPDRALFMVTTTCAMYCRYCTRKRTVGAVEGSICQSNLEQVTAYLATHPEITDVIISGGDPLTLSTSNLEKVIRAVRCVPTVEVIRIGTRTPVTLPMRITHELVQMLRKYQPIWINTHFNHPVELTAEAQAACKLLADGGFPLGNQSVLLRGVNDTPQVIEQLCRGLVKMRVRPYYLYQCDLVRGVEHFRTPLTRGLEIMEYLRGRLSGLAIPLFVVDAPHGGGKIPVMPNYIVSMSPTHTVLRNYEGMLVSYPEPNTIEPAQKTEQSDVNGVWELAAGKVSAIYPETSSRRERRKQRNGPATERA